MFGLDPISLLKGMGAESAINLVRPHVPKVMDFMVELFTTLAEPPEGARCGVLFHHAPNATGARTVMAKVYTLTTDDQVGEELAAFDVLREVEAMDVKAMLAKLKEEK